MPIQVGTAGLLKRRYKGDQEVKKVYKGDQLIYSSGPADLRSMWPMPGDTQPVVVMFVGSSTTQGEIGVTRQHENYVNQLSARLLTHANNAMSTGRVIAVTSGTQTRPTSNGIWFWNCGLGGTISSNYIGTDRQSLMDSLQPNIMIHMIGANDYRNQNVPYATYRNNIQAVINDARTRCPGVKHVLVHSYVPIDVTGNPTYTWEGYENELYTLEANNNDVITVSVRKEFEARGVILNGTDPDDLLTNDNIHSTPKGYKFLAETIATKLKLNDRRLQPIMRVDANLLTAYANGAEVTSVSQPADTMETAIGGDGQAAGQRPAMVTGAVNGNRALSFDGVDDTLDTNFVRSYGLPVTMFMVMKVTGGSASKPFFSRTTQNHNGYVWAFADSSTPRYRVYFPSNSPTGNDFVFLDPDRWVVMACVYKATDDQTMYMNSLIGVDSYSTGNDPNIVNGPFITSARYGANTGRSTFAQMQVAYGELVQGELTATEVAERMNALAARYAITLDLEAPIPPPPPPRTYLSTFGSQTYANTFQTGANRDLTADGWTDRSYATGVYLISDFDRPDGVRRLIASVVGNYRAFNRYYYTTQLTSTTNIWARVKMFKAPAATGTGAADAGVGLVLHDNGTSAIFCKITTDGRWKIYVGGSSTNDGTSTDPTPAGSGPLPQTPVNDDELTAVHMYSANRVYFYLNNILLNSGGTAISSTYRSYRRAGVIISSLPGAGELYDFKCGTLSGTTPPS
ncbi:minor tail protein [Gordonia phage ChisanaKitsune]|uniref:Minor tail protein n=1 Tax=Gordonia phage ChisanaKitsune TaxID=2871538 RepID=A0AAE8BXA0_9CAUD|nr:minor tail protein [Gordonia phage ChisanaKitsune]QZE10884.1 minor tail protein [Gordonia phage ChisanaKitsune]